MADTRELILARISEIIDTLPATVMGAADVFATTARNRGELMSVSRPALVVLDGDEVVNELTLPRGKGSSAARLITMAPEIAIIIGGREPQNEMIGEDLNAMRLTVIDAIAKDATLLTLTGTNGDIQYTGLVTDLGWNKSMEGIMVLSFAITYVFRIANL
jgi:hypothetical protein